MPALIHLTGSKKPTQNDAPVSVNLAAGGAMALSESSNLDRFVRLQILASPPVFADWDNQQVHQLARE